MSKMIDELNKFNERCKEEYMKKVERHESIKENYVSKQKVKDKIEHYKELQNNYIKKYDEVNDKLQGMINALEELLEDK